MEYVFVKAIRECVLTVHRQNMCLHHVIVPLCMTRVVSSMLQLNPRQIEAAVAENAYVFFVQRC